MSSLDDLEATTPVKDAEVLVDDDVGEDIHNDMLDAISLLSKCMRLLDYLSDIDLCKSVTARERGNMVHVANKVREFLDGAESLYEEE